MNKPELFAFSFFTDLHDNCPQPKRATWQELCTLLTRRETRETKDGKLFSPASYPAAKKRLKANVSEVSLLVLDFDNGTPPLPLMKQCRADGIACIIHSSYSSSRFFPKWRAIIPLSAPVPVDQWEPLFLRLSDYFGQGQMDGSCKDASRMFYLPACPAEALADAFEEVISGEPFDTATLPEPQLPEVKPAPVQHAPRHKTNRLPGENAPTVDNLISRAVQKSATEWRNNSGLWLACQLRDNDYSQSEAASALLIYQGQVENNSSEPYTQQEAHDAIKKAFARGKREAWNVPLVTDEEVQEALSEHDTDAVPADGETDEPAAPILKLRQSILTRHLRGIADVVPYAGLRYHKDAGMKGVRKASKTLRQFYGTLDNAIKYDFVDTYYAALKAFLPNGGERVQKGELRKELFGRWASQVANWCSQLGHFAENTHGRRRPHLPLRVHAAVRDLPENIQETVFDTYESNGYMTQEQVAAMIQHLMPSEVSPAACPPPAIDDNKYLQSLADDARLKEIAIKNEGWLRKKIEQIITEGLTLPCDEKTGDSTSKSFTDVKDDGNTKAVFSEASEETNSGISLLLPNKSEAAESTALVLFTPNTPQADIWREKYAAPVPEPEPSKALPMKLPIIPAVRQVARTLAEKRKQGHDHCRKSSESHGSEEANNKYEYWGVLAELLVIFALEWAGYTPKNYRFVADRALSEPDFNLNGVLFDVKAVLPDGSVVCINERKHKTPECRPHFYVIVLFESEEEATVSIVPASDVDCWDWQKGKTYIDNRGKQCQREPYRSLPKQALWKLREWDTLSEVSHQEPKKEQRKNPSAPFCLCCNMRPRMTEQPSLYCHVCSEAHLDGRIRYGAYCVPT